MHGMRTARRISPCGGSGSQLGAILLAHLLTGEGIRRMGRTLIIFPSSNAESIDERHWRHRYRTTLSGRSDRHEGWADYSGEIERQTVTRVKMDGTKDVVAHTGGDQWPCIGPDDAIHVWNRRFPLAQ